MRTEEGSDGLGGGVVDQPLSVFKAYWDSVDRHALVLRRLPPSFYKAVHQNAEQDEDSCAQDDSCDFGTWQINQNTFGGW